MWRGLLSSNFESSSFINEKLFFKDGEVIDKGKKIAENVSAMVVPGSGLVKEQAEKDLADNKDNVDFAKAASQLAEAAARLKTIQKLRKKI